MQKKTQPFALAQLVPWVALALNGLDFGRGLTSASLASAFDGFRVLQPPFVVVPKAGTLQL